MANGISKNPLTDISKVYLNQIAEGSLKSLEKASVLAMSDKPEDQDKAREIKTRFDYQSMLKQKKAKKMKEDVSNWRHDLREIIVTSNKDSEEPEIIFLVVFEDPSKIDEVFIRFDRPSAIAFMKLSELLQGAARRAVPKLISASHCPEEKVITSNNSFNDWIPRILEYARFSRFNNAFSSIFGGAHVP